LSEILIEAAEAQETGYQSGECDSQASESVENRVAELDRVLTPLVSANAEAIVRCPWLGGAEVTLAEAMKAYPSPMIEEDPHVLARIVKELLANPLTDTKEELDAEPEEDQEELEQQENTDKKDDRQPDKKSAQPNDVKPEETAKIKAQAEPAGSKATAAAQTKAEQSEFNPFKNQTETPADPQVVKIKETETQKAAGSPESPNADMGPNAQKGVEPAGFTTSASEKSVPEPTENDLASSVTGETAESTELLLSDLESEPINNAEIAFAEEEAELAPADGLASDSPEDFEEEEVLPPSNLEAEFEPEERNFETPPVFEEALGIEAFELLPQRDNTLSQAEEIETFEPEHIDKTNEIEDLLNQLSECIEAAEPETAEIANAFLDKINETPAKLEIDDEGNLINEAEVQEELEELFTEMFDCLEIEYTPELIESLIHLTIDQHLAGEAEKQQDDEDEEPQDSGTHEVIKKLLAGSNTIQRAVSQAPVIGKSALTLYSNRMLVEEYLTR
jgi:hypothetical protein